MRTIEKKEWVMNESNTTTALPAGFVALVGQPNVGKSTLMNAILGIKLAIATSKPQTTRTRILGVQTFPEKGQLCFMDTPGIHESKKRLNRALNQAALQSLAEVDLVCHLVDAAAIAGWQRRSGEEGLPPEEEFVQKRLKQQGVEAVLVVNKVDALNDKLLLLPMIEKLTEAGEYLDVVPVSALKKENLDQLVDVLLKRLPEQGLLFPPDMLTDQAEKFIAAEFVREQVMEQTRKEIPYSVAVEIEKFQEDERKGLLEISAVIHVERDTQKGIIIGNQGSRIKSIGSKARREMEKFFGKPVFLETFVRVEPRWSENPRQLGRFGYE